MTTSGADARDGGLWNKLQGVRLGDRERELLKVSATLFPDPARVCPVDAARSRRVSNLRAARRLQELGLVETRTIRDPGTGQRVVLMQIAPQGRTVYERFRRELDLGARIRWPRSDEPDGRFYW